MSTVDDDFDALLAEIASAPPVTGAADADLLVGRALGRYRVVERLGRGGMGVVYRAFDPELDRDVALKLLPIDASTDDAKRARFAKEARASAKLVHPHIAAIYDVGFDEESGVAYIAMELVRGLDLRHVLGAGAPSIADVERWALQIARASACAHAAGIVHRDLKPENVMIDGDANVKVLDFGLASRVADVEGAAPANGDVASASVATGIAGTPGYMAPEQTRGERVDARADVYAIGVVVRELLGGRSSSVLDDAVQQCLAEDATRRFRDGGALADALASRVTSVATPAITSPPGAWSLGRRRAPRALVAAIVGLALVAIVAVIAIVLGWRATRVREPPHLASIPIVSDDLAEQAAFRAAAVAFYDDLTVGPRMAADIVKRDPDAAAAWVMAAGDPQSVGQPDFWSCIAQAKAASERRTTSKDIVDLVALLLTHRAVLTPAAAANMDNEVTAFLDAHPGSYFATNLLRLDTGKPAVEMLATLERLWRLDPEPVGAGLDYVNALVTVGRRQEAGPVIVEIARRHPHNDKVLLTQAGQLLIDDRTQEARALLEPIERQKPDAVDVRSFLLMIARTSGDTETEEREVAALASGTLPLASSIGALASHARMLLAMGRVHDAKRAEDAAIELAGRTGVARVAPGVINDFATELSVLRDWDGTAKYAAALEQKNGDPDMPPVLVPQFHRNVVRTTYERAVFLGHKDDAAAKMAELEAMPDAAFSAPKDALLAFDRALLLALRGKNDDAFAALVGKTPPGAVAVYLEPWRRLTVADVVHDRARAASAANDLLALENKCQAELGDWEQICHVDIAWAYAIGAEAAHADGDDAKARQLVAGFDAFWPRADADAGPRARIDVVRTALR